jgi:hypothetical protein
VSGLAPWLRLLKPRTNFGMFLWVAFGILSIGVAIEMLLAPPVSSPPDVERALEEFTTRYAEAAVNDIRMTRDEVTVRSFEVEYRNKTTGGGGKMDVHYSPRGDGRWTPDPELPPKLP